MLQNYYPEKDPLEIRKLFGSGFSQSLVALSLGECHGPVLSGYGIARIHDSGRGFEVEHRGGLRAHRDDSYPRRRRSSLVHRRRPDRDGALPALAAGDACGCLASGALFDRQLGRILDDPAGDVVHVPMIDRITWLHRCLRSSTTTSRSTDDSMSRRTCISSRLRSRGMASRSFRKFGL
jgi:hypothetical protein